MIIGKSLTAIGGGGLKPEILVTAKAGALLNLHFKNSSIILKSYQLGETETQHIFVVDVRETAYVIDDVTNGKSVEVLVDTIAIFNAEISYGLYLYNEGDECTELTGGYDSYAYASDVDLSASSSNTESNISFNKYETYMVASQSSFAKVGSVFPNNAINLTDYSKLCWEGAVSGATDSIRLNIAGTKANSYARLATNFLKTSDTYIEVDISSISGNYYPCISVGRSYSDNSSEPTVTIKKLWLE